MIPEKLRIRRSTKQSNEEVAKIFLTEMKDFIKPFLDKKPRKLGQHEINILSGTNNHFGGPPVNLICCADEAMRRCIEFTKPYATQTPTQTKPIVSIIPVSESERVQLIEKLTELNVEFNESMSNEELIVLLWKNQ